MKKTLTTIGSVGLALFVTDCAGPETNKQAVRQAHNYMEGHLIGDYDIGYVINSIERLFSKECIRQREEDTIVPLVPQKVHPLSWDNTLEDINNKLEIALKHSGADICEGDYCEAGRFNGRRVMKYDGDTTSDLEGYRFPECGVDATFPSISIKY